MAESPFLLPTSISKKTVEFTFPTEKASVIADKPKRKFSPEHKHELVVLSHLVKTRLRKLIRRFHNRQYYLHAKRHYKQSARERKLFRRGEYDRKRKAAAKSARKGGAAAALPTGKGETKAATADGKEGGPKKSADKMKPPKRHQKWRENKYRKWKQLKFRARFTRQERVQRQFDYRHPGTRPFVRSDFGFSKNEELVRRIHRQRLSVRWSETLYPSGDPFALRPIPKVSPYMEHVAKPYPKQDAKRKLEKLLKNDWELTNHDRLHRAELVKGMANLILEAKERYDLERKQSQMSVALGTTSPQIPPTEEDGKIQSLINTELKKNLVHLMEQTPSGRLQALETRLLPQILSDKQLRRNTYINRPKTGYDSHLRRKLTAQTIQKYLQQRCVLASSKQSRIEQQLRQAGKRMPLPYRRFIVGNLRPLKIYLPGTRLRAASSRRGLPPTQPLQSILPANHPRVHVPKLGQKRPNYPKHHDPHNPEKTLAALPKKKKTEKGKDGKAAPTAKPKSKPAAKGMTPVRREAPSKGTKEYEKWHRVQKKERRKRKLRKWIIMAEKRRRIKITQEILQEEHFKGKRDLPAMRKKIRELEQQADRANQLVTYLSNRNVYLKEQNKDLHTRKHDEYYSCYVNWREESDNSFKLRDDIDTTNEEMRVQAGAFLARCQQIITETAELEAVFDKELTNLETTYTEIVQFIRHEPIWQEEIEDLLCKPLYYDYLYTFREAREDGNLNLVSDLLQRKMHQDFMNMAYQERRRMRRQLPNACKNMLDERGLLAQELNKISMWCNRLHRRQDKIISPETEECSKTLRVLKRKIHSQVVRRQPFTLRSNVIKWRLRRRSFCWPRQRTSYLTAESNAHKKTKKLERTENTLDTELEENHRQRTATDVLKTDIACLQGMVTRNYDQRFVNCQVIGKVAAALKRAFGVPEGFDNLHWPAKGAVQMGPSSDPHSMVAQLQGVLDMVRTSTIKTLTTAPVEATGVVFEGQPIFRTVPVALRKLPV